MKHTILYLVVGLLAGGLFASCSDEVGGENNNSNIPEGMGILSLDVENLSTVVVPEIWTRLETPKHEFTTEELNVDNYYIAFLNEEGTVVDSYDSFAELEGNENGAVAALLEGKYKAIASSFNRDGKNSGDKSYFYGETEVLVEEKKTSHAHIKCEFKSMGVEIRLGENLKKQLDVVNNSMTVKVSNDKEGAEAAVDFSYSTTRENEEGSTAKQTSDLGPKYLLEGCSRKLKVEVSLSFDEGALESDLTYYIDGTGQLVDAEEKTESIPEIGKFYVITLEINNLKSATPLVSAATYRMEDHE